MFKDKNHYDNCNFTESILLANETFGHGPDSNYTNQFMLNVQEMNLTLPLFIGCSKGTNFSHCVVGNMKVKIDMAPMSGSSSSSTGDSSSSTSTTTGTVSSSSGITSSAPSLASFASAVHYIVLAAIAILALASL